jgi:N-acetylmuramoyl-L-alanine amidase
MGGTVFRQWRALCLAAVLVTGVAGLVGDRAGAATGGQLFAVQLNAHGAATSVTLGLIRPMKFHAAVDAAARRLFVDFDDLTAMPGSSIGRGIGLVGQYHAEPGRAGGVRLVFDLRLAAIIAGIHAMAPEPGKPARAIIDLATADAASMSRASGVVYRSDGEHDLAPRQTLSVPANRAKSVSVVLPESRPAKPESPSIAVLIDPTPAAMPQRHPEIRPDDALGRRGAILSSRRVIVIDAGHGGVDPGAPSVAGYHEKEITLATARILRRVLEQTGRYKVIMTRDSDVFLKLHDRVALARAAHGNLFISLHADSVAGGAEAASDRITRGASIYTLSETASDAESERYAQRENRADAIGGLTLADQSDDVAGILVDLTVRETVNQGNRLAGMMAESLQRDGIALLPRAPHRAAGFAVLKSPDIPSVLIEMGYLSDPSDSRALADPGHQLQIARAVAEGVDHYFAWLDSSHS